ncbi:restriction endonuclease [Acidovorax sp. Leaf160]|uniref:restriction endonuclease n=1 Tax=Acidovorax sp. Leaf160 TaxID=1736280 RepID=UPI0006FC7D6B|nr:restriction endonuclease [Acidovorax sp. Leaf160]KQR57927.1 restriction endonuclease [Acidovorax sp. Leaf160]
MAPNSLFAILLRSPWWISFAAAAAIALLCGALLPAHLAPFAAVGVLPLVVVGSMAAWRQWRAPSAAQVEAVRASAAAMPWRDFSAALERAWQAEGHTVSRLNGQPADLRLERGGQTLLVMARRWKAATHGAEPLRELQAAVQAQQASAGVYVALQGQVSENARDFARDNGLVLMESDALAVLLSKAPAAGR